MVPMRGQDLALSRRWKVGEPIGGGGFGRVYEIVADGGDAAVAKFVPQAPGADRELLFVDLDGIRNVVPIIDHGEHEGHWVLVMPRADMSLRDHLESIDGPPPLADLVRVLKDVADSLVDLTGRVVHRDIKPENILLLEGRWCLADFGISRYTEATTAVDTHKFSLSPPYAAPERWRPERATTATDIYSLGIVAYEMAAGERPFICRTLADLREAHLHAAAPVLEGSPAGLRVLVEECMYKAAGARPSAADLRARLDRIEAPPRAGGLAALAAANQEEVARRSEAARSESAAQSQAERRAALADAARTSLEHISSALWDAIAAVAPAVGARPKRSAGWSMTLGSARLTLSASKLSPPDPWGGWTAPVFDVIAVASINLRMPRNAYDYEGRSHSLWYGDIQEAEEFGWFETAFMVGAFIPQRGLQDPFALPPGIDAAKALWNGVAERQLAWPFIRLKADELDEFIDRWAGWLANAADGQLQHPSQMPERPTQGSWRSS